MEETQLYLGLVALKQLKTGENLLLNLTDPLVALLSVSHIVITAITHYHSRTTTTTEHHTQPATHVPTDN